MNGRVASVEMTIDLATRRRSNLGRWTAELDELLSGNAAKPAREQLTLIRIFEDLRGRGYGGYDAVRRYARRWAKDRGQATPRRGAPARARPPPSAHAPPA